MGIIESFSLGQGEIVVSHLQFADDTIFCDNSQRKIRLLAAFYVVLKQFRAFV